MAPAAPRNLARMHEWACTLPAQPAAPTPAQLPARPLPVGDALELPAAEGWALWHSLAAPASTRQVAQ
jgi:hypothetical protein